MDTKTKQDVPTTVTDAVAESPITRGRSLVKVETIRRDPVSSISQHDRHPPSIPIFEEGRMVSIVNLSMQATDDQIKQFLKGVIKEITVVAITRVFFE